MSGSPLSLAVFSFLSGADGLLEEGEIRECPPPFSPYSFSQHGKYRAQDSLSKGLLPSFCPSADAEPGNFQVPLPGLLFPFFLF